MFCRKTVFVIGAGCSMEYGLPSGLGLRQRIIAQVPQETSQLFESAVGTALIRHDQTGDSHDRLIDAGNRIRQGLLAKPSIDQYLETHEANAALVRVGKLAISAAILREEGRAIKDVLSLDKGYLAPLSYALNDKVRLHELYRMFDNVTFITFNYDRIIEQFLVNSAVRLSGGLQPDQMARVYENIEVLHVYGQAGLLPHQKGDRLSMGSPLMKFGATPESPGLWRIADNLRTFSEGQSNPALKVAIRDTLDAAEKIVLMGFSYLPENMAILRSSCPDLREVYMLHYGMSEADTKVAMRSVSDTFSLGDRSSRIKGIWNTELFNSSSRAEDFMWNHYRTLMN